VPQQKRTQQQKKRLREVRVFVCFCDKKFSSSSLILVNVPKQHKATVNADPLSTTEEKMRLGYNFVIRPVMDTQQGMVAEKDKVVEKDLKRRKASTKVAASPKAKAVTKKRRSQAQGQLPKKQPNATSPVVDPGFYAQAVPTTHQILQFPGTSTSTQSHPMTRVFHSSSSSTNNSSSTWLNRCGSYICNCNNNNHRSRCNTCQLTVLMISECPFLCISANK